jgi:tetratricopeptide (TPR) repeat protein
MRLTLSFVFLALCVPLAWGDACSGAESQLAVVSRELARGLPDAAEAALGAVVASNPQCLEILLLEARIRSAKGDAANAGAIFMRYLQLAPADPRGYTYFGRFLLEQRQYQRADEVSASALEKAPNDPQALALRGQILDMKGDSQKGLELLKRACQADPDNVEAQFYLGTVFDRAKRPGEAVSHFRKVVGIDPSDARAWDYLALNLEPLGQIEEADQAYRKGLEVNVPGQHHDSFLDYNYGRFLMKRNQLQASKQHLDRAVELTPNVRGVWYERAKLRLRLEDYRQARSDAEKAAAIPDSPGGIIDLQVYSLLEQIYRHLGETELARKYAELSRETPVPARGEHR